MTTDSRSNHFLPYLYFRLYHIPAIFNFEVTLFVVETIVSVNKVSQVVLFILTQ